VCLNFIYILKIDLTILSQPAIKNVDDRSAKLFFQLHTRHQRQKLLFVLARERHSVGIESKQSNDGGDPIKSSESVSKQIVSSDQSSVERE